MNSEKNCNTKRCSVCGGRIINTIWNKPIRIGSYGHMTDENHILYQCYDCGLIWHNARFNDDYYISGKYREGVDGNTEIEQFWKLHDELNQNKYDITGTKIFRNKVVADIGCGAGSFLDSLAGIAKTLIAVEPTSSYLECLKRKGYITYSYLTEANKEYKEKADVVVCFDVIEHVDDLNEFCFEIHRLLKKGGIAIIGTPTEYKLMEELCGDNWKQFNYRYQHPWILSEKAMNILGEKAGFSDVRVEFHQQYGLSNLLMWLKTGRPNGNPEIEFINKSLDVVFKENCNNMKIADYIVAYMTK